MLASLRTAASALVRSTSRRGRAPGAALDVRLVAAAAATGVAAGVGGIVLTLILHGVQHLSFGYTEATFLRGVERAPGWRRVVAVTVGGVLVGLGWWWHRRRVDSKSISITAALRADRAHLPVLATGSDALLQIVAVGAGASLGREGAPRQVGAAAGGWIARRLKLTPPQSRTVLACGAGAGLAAVYNVPLGGTAFTLEILLASLALADVTAALVSSAVATVVSWTVLPDESIYQLPQVHLSAPVWVWSVLAGPVLGVSGWAFSSLMTSARRHAPRDRRSILTIPVAFAALGALAIWFPQLLGNGKGQAELALTAMLPLALAGALVVLKPVATALCLGAGAIGGLLTPAVATGAALGAFLGGLWSLVWPGASATQYAIIGAAALLAVTQRAPVVAVVLTLELVGTGQTLLAPMVLAVASATFTARRCAAWRPRRPEVRIRPGSG